MGRSKSLVSPGESKECSPVLGSDFEQKQAAVSGMSVVPHSCNASNCFENGRSVTDFFSDKDSIWH